MIREYTQNRELSWLKFNERVLAEAADETVLLLERLKFISIFSSNLDEFFMIRVGSLSELMGLKESEIDKKSGMSPAEQLSAIYKVVGGLYKQREEIYSDVEHQLRAHGICNLFYKELEDSEKKYLKKYFHDYIEPVLSPQIVDQHHPFPHLMNKTVHIGVSLSYKNKDVFGVIPVPAILPSIIYLKDDESRYIRIEEVIGAYLAEIFSNYEIKETVYFCITRNADINPEDEAFDFGADFRKKMKKVLKIRRRLGAVRLELSNPISKEFMGYLTEKIGLSEEQTYVTALPLKMDYAFGLSDHISQEKAEAHSYSEFEPQPTPQIDLSRSVIKQVQQKDVMLSYPFESMEPFLRLLKEAASDASVVSIKITIYRLASHAKLVEYLCRAAENGKDVTVIIELRARFDEQNNIDWSEQLENAGCTVIYGVEEYKVHSKVCLITMQNKGMIHYITQIGTGNYNEKTAKQYTDLSLITANPEIGADAAELFKNIAIGNLHGTYRHLLVSPHSLKSAVLQKMNREIAKGEEGRIILKMNSVTDLDLIEKLKQASVAGVEIHMIIRGICCILPGTPGKTERIEIKSIVGRYLEHSRIYSFGRGDEEIIYISSADFMTRNTERRVEVACPVYDPACKEIVREVLRCCLEDTVKGRVLQEDGQYIKIEAENGNKKIDCQQFLMTSAIKQADSPCDIIVDERQNQGLISFIKSLFKFTAS